MRKELSKENINESLIKEEIRLFKEKIEWNRDGNIEYKRNRRHIEK